MTSVIVLSGISGSGKSTAMNLFEDLGYFCVDNLPPTLLSTFVELCEKSKGRVENLALAIDARQGVFLESAPLALHDLKKSGIKVEVLFLDCSDERLIHRYKETRRKHPMDSSGDIRKGIERERKRLRPIAELADEVIDTSNFTPGELKEVLKEKFDVGHRHQIALTFLSFAYRHGIPADADLVFDARFLPNPHYIDELEPLTGLDSRVRDFVLSKENTGIFIRKLVDILRFLLPLFEKEGKSYLTVAVGCTGGKHRSVVIAEEISRSFASLSPTVRHRELAYRRED